MALRFHPPHGELKYWSILWLLFGIAGSIIYAIAGRWSDLWLTVPLGLLTLGIWLRSKVCGQLLVGLLSTACFLAIPFLFRGGDFDWPRLIRIGLCGYFAFLVFDWVSEFDDHGRQSG